MLPWIIGLVGAVIGGLIAYRRKGKLLDIAQYAGAYFLAFAIIGLIIGVVIVRSA
jgi:uncharacterized membrane protein YeaQ/YmgE (transglycosylase-associated protein family)